MTALVPAIAALDPLRTFGSIDCVVGRLIADEQQVVCCINCLARECGWVIGRKDDLDAPYRVDYIGRNLSFLVGSEDPAGPLIGPSSVSRGLGNLLPYPSDRCDVVFARRFAHVLHKVLN